jgi:hypothetical protein
VSTPAELDAAPGALDAAGAGARCRPSWTPRAATAPAALHAAAAATARAELSAAPAAAPAATHGAARSPRAH